MRLDLPSFGLGALLMGALYEGARDDWLSVAISLIIAALLVVAMVRTKRGD